MQVVVTGASGHIGRNLIRLLLDRGDEVRALGHSSIEPLQSLDVQIVKGDVLDRASLRMAFAGTEIVYHLAGIISLRGDPDGNVRAVNVRGAANAARAALEAGARRMVHCSSVHAFDLEARKTPLDETERRTPDESGRTAYDRSKAAGEREVRAAVVDGLDAVIVHPTSVIGPLDPAPSPMGRFFLRLFHHKLPALVDAAFDFVDVRDVALGMVSAAERGRTGESYLLAGHYRRISELADIAAEVLGRRRRVPALPLRIARLGVRPAALLARIARSEPLVTGESLRVLRHGRPVIRAKAEGDLGFTVRSTEASILDVYRWFAATGYIPQDALPRDSRAHDAGEWP
jgi:dihydroflavonol-4-reductase